MRIIVGGYIIGYPLGGMTWHHLNYLAGLHDMGHEVWFYEDSGQWYWPYNPITRTCSDEPAYGIPYLQAALRAVGIPDDRWCYYSEFLDRYYGLTQAQWLELVGGADVFISVSGVTPWREEFRRAGRTCIIDTDPVYTQLRMSWDANFLQDYQRYDRAATFGRLIGTPDSRVPTAGVDWIPTHQPIAMRHWPVVAAEKPNVFTTLGKWDHGKQRTETFEGREYTSSKGVEWEKLLTLPQRSPFTLELAMDGVPDDVRPRYESHGWRFEDPTAVSVSTDAYRDFIQSRAGEFTVVKQIYAGLPSGWFSDRSAAFLASGRPVITQSSGFEKWLPTGEGLFSFATIDEAAAALEAVASDPHKHARAARDIAAAHFDARVVLSRLLDTLA